MLHDVKLPEFSYLTKRYEEDFVYIENFVVYRLNIRPDLLMSIQDLYNKLDLLKKMNHGIYIKNEFAEIVCAGHKLKLPIEILKINIHDSEYILRPTINSVLVSRIGIYTICIINIDFTNTLQMINNFL